MRIVHYPEGLALQDYLDCEQDLLAHVDEPTIFTWIVAPTVIYGRHQQRAAEVNEAYCRENGIDIVQRKSGGGCVYADAGNLMISMVTPDVHSERVFDEFLSLLSGIFADMGLEAISTAHNDILIGGRKVSGSACFTSAKGTIVHGTVLFNVNLDALTQAITPPAAKLAKNGVASVRQRVVNISELTDMFDDIHALRTFMEKRLCLLSSI